MKSVIDESKFLTKEEIKRLRSFLSDAAKVGGHREKVRWMIVDLGLSAGLRASEIANLQIEHCFLGHGQSSITVVEGKCGKTAPVIISDKLKAHLKRFIKWRGVDEGPLLLTKFGKPYGRAGIWHVVKQAFKALGLPSRYTCHSLRHSCASHLYAATKDLRLVQQVLRHSSPNVTTVYANLLSEEVKEGMNSLYT